VKIELLYFAGCPNHLAAEELLHDVIADLGQKADIAHVEVPDQETAVRMKFPGSPSIRINGIDVEPGSSPEQYSLQCRVYQTPAGLSGVPSRESVRAAIARAGESAG
jgi:hypothetical protein